MIKKMKKVMIAKYDNSKKYAVKGSKKRNNIIVIYDSKTKKNIYLNNKAQG